MPPNTNIDCRLRRGRGVPARVLLVAEQDVVPPPALRQAAATRPLAELQGRDTLADGAGGTHPVKVSYSRGQHSLLGLRSQPICSCLEYRADGVDGPPEMERS